MTTLDDKILGEKLQYYYSSSEDEGSDNEDEDGESKTIRDANVNEPEIEYSADGSAVNTGRKHTFEKMTPASVGYFILKNDTLAVWLLRTKGCDQ